MGEAFNGNQKIMLALAMLGFGLILLSAVAYMHLFCYSVITKSMVNGVQNITITYVYPLDAFFPLMLIAGLVLSFYGSLKSRKTLAMNKRRIALVFGLGAILTIVSALCVNHVTAISHEAYEYGFPLPWLVYLVNGVSPIHKWIIHPYLIFVLPFWLCVACAGLLLFARLNSKIG